MLLKLMNKEIRLSMHPMAIIMLALSAMMLIPSYPYTVTFFYITLAIFFTCLQGRENNDVVYSLTLPITKKDVVFGRFAFVVTEQIVMMLLSLGCILLRPALGLGQNDAGMDATVALLGFGFVLFGIFNLIFFTAYYKNVSKIGVSFFRATVVFFLVCGIIEASSFIVPFVRDYLDTPSGEYEGYKLITLTVGFVIYALLTWFSYKRSVKSFEKQDI